MASNSRAQILEKMQAGSITRGWGAVCAFNRERLNRVLQQQWLEKYDGTNYLPVFSGRMDLNELKTEYGVLTNVMLGRPLLSFEPAALDNSRAKLTLSILGGNFAAYEDTYGLMYEFDISEAHGYTLTVELDLSLVVGVVDRLGRVTLDLSKGTKFTCNLAGPAASQAKIGAFFDEAFKALPQERQVYVLGMLDLKGRNELTPTNFIILTQRAPGAEVLGAANAPDGAVVVMVQLRGDEMGGEIPSPERFPYLIPDDGDYSATMVLAQKYVERSDDQKLVLIQSLLFPGEENVFVEHSRHEPADLVIFGSLDPSRTSLTIDPMVRVVKAGGQAVQYRAFINGAPANVNWSVRSLNSNTSAGSINPTSGLYQPVSRDALGRELVRNIVTASYEDPETQLTHEVRALLLVTTRAMAISPAAAARIEGQSSKTVTFVASALSGATLTWKQPRYGSLSVQGNTAIYSPPSASQLEELPEYIVEEPIVVEDNTGESVTAVVVLTKAATTIGIEPAFVSGVGRSATLTFKDTFPGPDDVERTWTVIGDGTINDGVYTAPVTTSRDFDIVRCEIKVSGITLAGYSLVKLAAHQEEPGWNTITDFRLYATRSEQVFANGYQQIPVEAYIETDGARLTDEEANSLRIYYKNSNQQVPEIKALQEGIELEDAPTPQALWAQTRVANRFKPFPGSREAQPQASAHAEPNRVNVFLVTREHQPTNFYAAFTDYNGNTWRSDIDGSEERGVVLLVPVPPPTPDLDHYSLKRKRVAGGSGGSGDPNDDYEFDWYLDTVDYWDLGYLREGRVGVDFQAAEVTGEFISMVQWESRVDNETMFTYTGYGYNDPLKKDDASAMHYDQALIDGLKIELDPKMIPGNSLGEGRFRVGLFRCGHGVNIRRGAHQALQVMEDMPLAVRLIDDEGNPHALSIGIKSGDRNRLVLDHLGGEKS